MQRNDSCLRTVKTIHAQQAQFTFRHYRNNSFASRCPALRYRVRRNARDHDHEARERLGAGGLAGDEPHRDGVEDRLDREQQGGLRLRQRRAAPAVKQIGKPVLKNAEHQHPEERASREIRRAAQKEEGQAGEETDQIAQHHAAAGVGFFVAEDHDLRGKGEARGEPEQVPQQVAGGEVVDKREGAAAEHGQRNERFNKAGLLFLFQHRIQKHEHRRRILQHDGGGGRGVLDGAHIEDAGKALHHRAEHGFAVDLHLEAAPSDPDHEQAQSAPGAHDAEGRPRDGFYAYARKPPQQRREDDIDPSFVAR